MKKNRLREEILRQTINHLDWLCCTYGYYRMSYPELCQYVYRVYTKQLEPLRLQYQEGKLNERMHWLLTRGYKYARELCRDHDIAWPPQRMNHCFIVSAYPLRKEAVTTLQTNSYS